MNILVIGNGFDLAHGLPTKYTDFLEFVKMIKIIKEKNISNDGFSISDAGCNVDNENLHHAIRLIILNKANNNELERDLKEVLDYIDHNFWIEYFLQCPMYQKENWVDFESEIRKVIKAIDDDMKSLDDIIETLPDFIKKVYKKNILENGKKITYRVFRDKLLVDLKRLIRAFEIYLTEYVEKIEIHKKLSDIDSLEIDHVLSFNYTHTYKKVYGKSKNIEYDYIHGEADIKHTIETNKMVLGIDEYLGKKKRNKQVDFIAFKKFYQRIHKQTGCKYKKWVDDIYMNYMIYINNEKKLLEQSNNGISTRQTFSFKQMQPGDEITVFDTVKYEKHNIYFFGHSLDITDKDILRDLILNDNVYTTIFYHDKDTMGQQIANLVKVIEQDELIKRTGGSTKTIEFKEQQE